MANIPRPKYTRYIETDLGTEACCARCKELWPADREFFYVNGGTLGSWCKACHTEHKIEKGRVPGYGNGPAKSRHEARA